MKCFSRGCFYLGTIFWYQSFKARGDTSSFSTPMEIGERKMRQAMTADTCNPTIVAAALTQRMAVLQPITFLTCLLKVFVGNAGRNTSTGLTLPSCSTRPRNFDAEQPLATNKWARHDVAASTLRLGPGARFCATSRREALLAEINQHLGWSRGNQKNTGTSQSCRH